MLIIFWAFNESLTVKPFGADNGIWTRNAALEGLNVTITLYPHIIGGLCVAITLIDS